jgi:hypothetical protein
VRFGAFDRAIAYMDDDNDGFVTGEETRRKQRAGSAGEPRCGC